MFAGINKNQINTNQKIKSTDSIAEKFQRQILLHLDYRLKQKFIYILNSFLQH